MKIVLSLLTFSMFLSANNIYESCATTNKEALNNLTNSIEVNIQSNINEKIVDDSSKDSVESIVSSSLKTESKISLVDIKYEMKDGKTCASVKWDEQVKHTKKLLSKVLSYKKEQLPKDVDLQIEELDKWLNELSTVEHLTTVFLNTENDNITKIKQQEKTFKDLRTDALSKAKKSVWKSCSNTQKDARLALGKKLFANKGKEEEKSIWSSIVSVVKSPFTSKEDPLIDRFQDIIIYSKKDNMQCAIIKKDELKVVTDSMYHRWVKLFREKNLSKNPKEKYRQINNYIKNLEITNALVSLYPKTYKLSQLSNLSSAKKTLQKLKTTTYPQLVIFHIKGDDVEIKLNDKIIKNNTKNYIKNGDYRYTITAKGSCPIIDSFSIDLLDEDKIISKNFDDYKLPILTFVTDKNLNIVFNSQKMKLNEPNKINKCKGEARYIIKYASQTRKGVIELEPNLEETIELDFLTQQEIDTFNNSKTLNFKTTSSTPFSESIADKVSENLEYSLEDDVTHGSLELDKSGSFTYKSEPNYVGLDSFTYKIITKNKTSAKRVVNINVELSKTDKLKQEAIRLKEEAELKAQKLKESKEKLERLAKEKAEKAKLEKERLEKLAKEKVEKLKEKKDDLAKKVEDKTKVEPVKVNLEEKTSEEDELRYQKFKIYVESQEQNIEKLKKLQKKYPKLFGRLLKEKTGQ